MELEYDKIYMVDNCVGYNETFKVLKLRFTKVSPEIEEIILSMDGTKHIYIDGNLFKNVFYVNKFPNLGNVIFRFEVEDSVKLDSFERRKVKISQILYQED
jgi:hypothetical protein